MGKFWFLGVKLGELLELGYKGFSLVFYCTSEELAEWQGMRHMGSLVWRHLHEVEV